MSVDASPTSRHYSARSPTAYDGRAFANPEHENTMPKAEDQLPEAHVGVKKCSVEGCRRKAVARRLCSAHWQRWRRHGDVSAEEPITKAHFGAKNNKWNGGETNDGKGRVMTYNPGHPYANKWGYVYRYRIVMEKAIGRFLKPEEIVHHKDENKANDAIENLELMSQSKHINIHRPKMTKARFGK